MIGNDRTGNVARKTDIMDWFSGLSFQQLSNGPSLYKGGPKLDWL